MSNKAYTIEYREHSAGKVQSVSILAKNKMEAYDKFCDEIEKVLGSYPYSAWVSSVTYQNGNYRVFNNFEGKPY